MAQILARGGKMIKKVLLFSTLGLLLALPATAKPHAVKGSAEHKTQETYEVAPFTHLVLQGQTEVEFTQNQEGTYTISYKGPHNLAELVDITSQQGVLHIKYSKPILVLGDQHLKVSVSAPSLERIEVQEAGEIHVHTPLAVENLVLVSNGKGEIELDQVQAQSVSVEVSNDSDIDIGSLVCQTLQAKANNNASFDVQRADCDTVSAQAMNRAEVSISGLNGQTVVAESWHASETELKGKVARATLTAQDHSEIDAKSLQADNADVSAVRSARIGVRVAGTLNASADNRSEVKYKGWPEVINKTGKGVVKQDR